MGTRRWIGELESWLRRSGMTKEELAERSGHSASHVLGLFDQADPNPTLRLYLDLANTVGARFHGVENNDPLEVIKRLKEIAAREKIVSISALAKVAGVNRSQLSSMLNGAAPNPLLQTFHRLVVALGAEQDFVLVDKMDQVVAQAVAAGETEVRAVKQEVKGRHLHAVPTPATSAADPERGAREAEAERAAERDAEVQAKLAEVNERVKQLQIKNVALEKQRADAAAEIIRLTGANATLERLRAENAAEIARVNEANRELERRRAEDAAAIARLIATKDWSLGRKIAWGFGCFATGAGIAALVVRGLRPST